MPDSKVHIKHELPAQRIIINVFGDTPAEAMQLLVDTMARIEGNTPNDPAPSAYTQRPQANPARPQPQPRGNGGGAGNAPLCEHCGQADQMELIKWPDRNTGEQRQAWKCQRCNKWAGRRDHVETLPY